VVGDTKTLSTSDTFSIKSDTPARYYVVWLTQLVQDGPDQFQGSISEVSFKR